MASNWPGSLLLYDDDEEEDEVFEASSSITQKGSPIECRIINDGSIDNVPGYVAASASNSHIVTSHQGLVTLHSLSGGHDSGYVPSPPAFHSFTSSSSDEDESNELTKRPRPGVTPPITIPHSCWHPPVRRQTSHRSRQENFQMTVQDSTPKRQMRSKSCPATSRVPILQCLQVPRRLTVTPMAGRGDISFTCGTSTNEQFLLIPPLRTTNPSMQDNKDTSEEATGTLSHERRVLVLALPDRIIESERHSTSSSAEPSPNPARTVRGRALSCEVTLAEEVGRKLRWIADSFFAARTPFSEAPSPVNSKNINKW